MKTWGIPFFLTTLLLFSLLQLPVYGVEREPADLENLVSAALANNPDLKASQARWEMFTNRVKHAGRLEDPMLNLRIQNGLISDPFNFRREAMTQKVIGISQQLPFWGKRKLREEVAEKEAETYRWLVEERKLELARMVKETWYQLFSVDRSLGIVAKNLRIMEDFTTLVETRYSVGKGLQQDILKAQLERSRMLDMQISLRQQRKTLEATLNTLLYRPVDTPVGTPPQITLQPLSLNAAELLLTAETNRPMIKSYQAVIEKGESAKRLAEKEFYPDFNVSFDYMQRDSTADEKRDDMYAIGVSFNLPVFTHHRHEMVAESSSQVTMAVEELKGLKNSITNGIADLMAQLERRRNLVELYRTGIIPQAEESLESATIGYRVNKVDFLTLLDSRVILFNYEREYYDSMADYQVKRAQLEALVGRHL